MTDYIDEVFGANGILSRALPGYETRAGQVSLARTIDKSYNNLTPALAEGPCGTGKSLAYSVPAIWHAKHRKQRTVIVTANIALQEQLFHKDLPLLKSVLPWDFTYMMLKGRSNFLCLDRLRQEEGSMETRFAVDSDRQQYQAIFSWSAKTERGDVHELPMVIEPRIWSKFSVGSDDCKGSKCPEFGGCWYQRAKAEAEEASIIVTNYHVLFAHLKLREQTGEDLVLPKFDALICDEAHELADIAREFLGFDVTLQHVPETEPRRSRSRHRQYP